MVRPHKYKEEYPEKMVEYFRKKDHFPTFELFAAEEVGVSIATLYNWRDKHPELLDAWDRCLAIQKGRMMCGAIQKDYSENFTKFLLINNHGMKEKSEQDLNVGVKKDLAAALAEEIE